MTIYSPFKHARAITAFARAQAYLEAAMHLELTWSDDPREIQEGRKLSRRFHALAGDWIDRAQHFVQTASSQPGAHP